MRLVAMVEIGRYIEAEREAQSHTSWRVPNELDVYFDAIRLLDQCDIDCRNGFAPAAVRPGDEAAGRARAQER